MSEFTISELARRVGLNPKAIRHYEEIGLLPQPARNEVGYRLYSDKDLPRICFIQRAKMLGLGLHEVKRLVNYTDEGCCNSLQDHLLALVEEKLVEVDRRLAELATFRDGLRRFHDELAAEMEDSASEPRAPLDASSCWCVEPDQTPQRRT